MVYLPSEDLFKSGNWREKFEAFTGKLRWNNGEHPTLGGLFVIPSNLGIEHFEQDSNCASVALFAGDRLRAQLTERRYADGTVRPHIMKRHSSSDEEAMIRDRFYRQVLTDLLRSAEGNDWNALYAAIGRLERACGRGDLLANTSHLGIGQAISAVGM